jgi:sulfide dehydrogenase [flavocytochrome c] flavoprotein subunit
MMNRIANRRRRALLAAATAAATTAALATPRRVHAAEPPVLVIGGGFGGATAAKQLRLASKGTQAVTLIEPAAAYVSCPLSNLVVGGLREIGEQTLSYDGLRRHGVVIVARAASAIDPQRRLVTLDDGSTLPYRRLILAPGIDFDFDAIDGLAAAHASGRVLHAWKAGPETVALRAQLEAMRDGGVFVLAIPELPIRCPPAPYERACLVAAWLKAHKPRSKVIVLDANPDIAAEAGSFKRAFRELYPGLVDYRPQEKVVGVDGAAGVLKLEVDDDVRGDVLNVLAPMRAGAIATRTGLATINQRWCGVDFLTFESAIAPDIHVIGDAIQDASAMPKSGHVANRQAKVAAAAVLARIAGRDPDPAPVLESACFSFVSETAAIRFSAVHRYDPQHRTYVADSAGAAGSNGFDAAAAADAKSWAKAIWADSFG